MKSNTEDQSNRTWYPPSNDIIFKLLWRKSIRLFTSFISLIIKSIPQEDFKGIYFTDTEQQISADSKQTRLDIKVNIGSGISINTEMQNYKQTAYIVRIIIYLSQALIGNNTDVKQYKDFRRVINLSVLNYNEFRDDKSIHHLAISDLETGKLATNIMEIYIFEAKKAAKNDISNPLTAWGKFFASTTEEECMQAAELDPNVAEAAEIVRFFNLDEKTRALIREEELRRLDLVDKIESAKEEGMRASHADVWNAATINVAKGMLKNNEPIDKIVSYTKLPIETIYSLKSGKNVDLLTKN